MRALISLLRPLAGLFVDDGLLALAVICIVLLTALLASLMPSMTLAAGVILLFGCLLALLTNVLRAARHKRVR